METFSISSPERPMQGMSQTQGMRVQGTQPSGTSSPLVGVGSVQQAVAQADNPTWAALSKMGQAALAPVVEAETKKQFFEGMRRVMAGEAVTDIVEGSPWYANIFGPAAAVQGARHYAKEAGIAKWAAGVESNMPNLAKMTPDEASAYVYQQLEGMFTGDSETDMGLLSSAVDMIGPVMKQQAKAHYAYNQNKAQEEQLNTWGAQATLLSGIWSDPTSTEQDRQAAGLRFLGQISPFLDQTDQSYDKAVTQLLEGVAQRGEFQVFSLLKGTKVPGTDGSVWDKLPYDIRTQLDQNMSQYGRQAVTKALPNYAVDMQMLLNDSAQDPRGFKDKVDAMNAKIARETGVPMDVAKAIPDNAVGEAVGGILRAQASASASGQSALVDQAKTDWARSMATQPEALASGKAQNVIDDKHAQIAMADAWNSQPAPAARAALLNNNITTASGEVKADIQRALSVPQFTDGVIMHGEIVKNLTEEAKGHYPVHLLNKIEQYNKLVGEGWDMEAAWNVAPMYVEIGKASIREDGRDDFEKSLVKVVQKNNPWLSTMVGGYGNELTKSSRDIAYAMLNQDINSMGRGAGRTMDSAVAGAYHRATMNGTLQIYGTHAVMSATPQFNKPLSNFIQGTPKEIAQTFDAAMRSKAEAAGLPMDVYAIMRLPDQEGRAVFYVTTSTEEGRTHNFQFSSEDIADKQTGFLKAINPTAPAEGIVPIGKPSGVTVRYK